MGVLYMKVSRPLPPQPKFLDETLVLHRILNESSIAKDILNRILISNFSSLSKMLGGLQMNLTSHAEQFDDVEMETDGLNDTISSLRMELDVLDLKLQSLRKVVSNLQQTTDGNITYISMQIRNLQNELIFVQTTHLCWVSLPVWTLVLISA